MYSSTSHEKEAPESYEEWKEEQLKQRRHFHIYYFIFQILAIIIFCLVLVWLLVYSGGAAWTSAKIFNLHPLFMVLGFIICYGEGILLYRAIHFLDKYPVKIMHVIFQTLAYVFAILGLTTIIIATWANARHFYSIHAWLGLTIFALFSLQLISGLAVYLLPCASPEIRKAMMPIHTAMGLAIFVMSGVNVLLGITESNMSAKGYDDLPPQQLAGNILALFVALFVAVAAYGLTKKEWKRPADSMLIK